MVKKGLLKSGLKMLIAACFMTGLSMLPAQEVRAEVQGFWQYGIADDGTAHITGYTGAEANVTVPSKLGGAIVTQIGNRWDAPFENNDFLVKVTIPSSVKRIGTDAFRDCDNLENVIGGAGIEVFDTAAFYSCDNLKSIEFGNKLWGVGEHAFAECKNLSLAVKLPSTITTIAYRAFYNCDSITSVSIPDANIGHFADDAFRDCDGLKKVTIGVVPSEECFRECDSLTTVVISNGVKEIEYAAFYNCKNLSNITFSSSLRNIGSYAFGGCSSLKKIDLPASVRYISDHAFKGCSSVESIDLKYGLLEIDEWAFEALPLITEVVIPNSVKIINYGAFYNCQGLRVITIPNSVTTIGTRETFSDAVIYCYADSFAHKVAVERGLKYVILEAKPTTNIKFSKASETIVINELIKLSPIVSPSNTTDAITWQSSDAGVASVNELGEVTGKNVGLVTIIATTTSGKKATININVKAKPTMLYYSAPTRVAIVGKNFTYKPVVKDDAGTRNDVRVTYTSSNTSIATVSSTGVVTPKKAGTVTITASAAGLKSSYTLTVVNSLNISNNNVTTKLNVSSCTYNGKSRTPSVIASFNGVKLVKGTDYTVTYKNNIYPGKASVIITGKGKFTGSVTKTLTIKAVSISPKQKTSAYANNSITLTWGKVTGATGYEVYRATTSTGTYKKVATTKNLSYKNSSLKAGTTYYYKVKAYKTVSGVKKYIGTSSAKAMITRPSTPTAKVTAGTRKATITWNKVTGASGYEVYMSTSKTGTYSRIKTVGSSVKSITKTSLVKGKRYYFKVKAYKTINGTKVYSGTSVIASVVVK